MGINPQTLLAGISVTKGSSIAKTLYEMFSTFVRPFSIHIIYTTPNY